MARLHRNHSNVRRCDDRGVILLVTLIFLVVLASLAYTLTTTVTARRHRRQYMMDYCTARYACDSALKYAFTSLETVEPNLISRPNDLDFSDLFAMSEPDYQEMLAQWVTLNPGRLADGPAAGADVNDSNDVTDANDANDVNDIGNTADSNSLVATSAAPGDSNSLVIPGPYGPPWPYIVEPMEFEIGSAKVKIEIDDENAKYPLAWVLLEDEKISKEAEASFATFLEWMGFEAEQIDSLKEELDKIREIRPFKLEFKPLAQSASASSSATAVSSRSRRRTAATTVPKKVVTVAEQAARQSSDLSRLFHSSLVDIDVLAEPTIASDTRKESALKYTGLWGAAKVNINTAPRHVLEAAFTFGGLSDAPKIAEQIIQRRREKPFENIEDLRKSLLTYSVSIQKCENFITTTSNYFTVKVTAVSGVARTSTVAAVTKEGNKIKQIGVISD